MFQAPQWRWLSEHPEITLHLHGQRAVDMAMIGDTDVFAPLAIRAPLAAWTNEDVATYIREHEIALLEHYAEVRDSFECWVCPALPDGRPGQGPGILL